jgi:hypothetical protein
MPTMKKIILAMLVFAIFPQGVAAETLYGLELAPTPMREQHLNHFMQLFRDFCLGQQSQQTAKNNLLSSGRFRPAQGFEGVYEEYFDGLSYAVTPDPEFCTVDVLLEYQTGKLLFSQEAVKNGVTGLFKYRQSKSSIEFMDGPNAERVQTIVSDFQSADGIRNKIVLMYPTNNQDVFYMTLDYYFK